MVKQAWVIFLVTKYRWNGKSNLTLSCQAMAVACYGLGVLKEIVQAS